MVERYGQLCQEDFLPIKSKNWHFNRIIIGESRLLPLDRFGLPLALGIKPPIAASTTISWSVAVSAAAPPCVVTATMAPVSMSTAFSACQSHASRRYSRNGPTQ